MHRAHPFLVIALALVSVSAAFAIPPNTWYEGEVELEAEIVNRMSHPGASAAPLEFWVDLHYTSTESCKDLLTHQISSHTWQRWKRLRMREGDITPYRYIDYLYEERVECGDGLCDCWTSNTGIEDITVQFTPMSGINVVSDLLFQDDYFDLLGSSYTTVPGGRRVVTVDLAFTPLHQFTFDTELTVRPHVYAGQDAPELGPYLESQLSFLLEPQVRIEGKRRIFTEVLDLWSEARQGTWLGNSYELSNLHFQNFLFTPRSLSLVHDPVSGTLDFHFEAYVVAWLTCHAFLDLPWPIPNLSEDVSVSVILQNAVLTGTLEPDPVGGYLLGQYTFEDNNIGYISVTSNGLLDLIADGFGVDEAVLDEIESMLHENASTMIEEAANGLHGNQALEALVTAFGPDLQVSLAPLTTVVDSDVSIALLDSGSYPQVFPQFNSGLDFGYKMVDGHLTAAFESAFPDEADLPLRLARTAEEIARGGGSYFVMNIPWKVIEPVLIPLGFPFEDYRDVIRGNLQPYEELIDRLLAAGITPVIAVGEGKESSVPNTTDGRRVRPAATNSPSPGDPYNTIGRDDYLAYLSRHVTAVASLLDRRVVHWAVENELNAANRLNNKKSIGRENGPFDANSRCGSLWSNSDGSGLGAGVDDVFLDIVAAIWQGRSLAGAPSTRLSHQFESFEQTEQKILDWAPALDVVGINVFVNTAITDHHPGTGLNEPMGFMNGEYVYAVKRLLSAHGLAAREVWLTSTTYPVFEGCGHDELEFTRSRQWTYADDAVFSLKDSGADVFIWTYFLIDELDVAGDCQMLRNTLGATAITHADGSVTYTATYDRLRQLFPPPPVQTAKKKVE